MEHAIKGMLPKNRLGRKLFTNAKIYAGPTHPHGAQKPEKIEI
jgi:large subunit ribosomal protein L13